MKIQLLEWSQTLLQAWESECKWRNRHGNWINKIILSLPTTQNDSSNMAKKSPSLHGHHKWWENHPQNMGTFSSHDCWNRVGHLGRSHPGFFHTVLTTQEFFHREKTPKRLDLRRFGPPYENQHLPYKFPTKHDFIGKINQPISGKSTSGKWHLQATPRRISAAGERPCRSFGAGKPVPLNL